MVAFLVIGSVGLAIVLLSLIVGEIFDGLFGVLDVDVGGGVFSAPVLGSFLAAFGFGAALIQFSTDADATIGALGGLGAGALVGGIALVMMRTLIDMPTDETVSTSGLVGASGVVITNIREDGYGEVTIRHHGKQHKYNARANTAIASGRPVTVTAVLSSSAVLVEPTTAEPATTTD